jgi:hypothetical protein
MMTRKELFESKYYTSHPISKIVVAVKLPTGATEIIVNTEDIQGKFNYYLSAYNDDLKLNNNPMVEIIDYMFV